MAERHPRWTFHFTPTSASWLNAVEGFFAKLTRKRLKRGVFGSLVELQAAINRFLAETNANPKPFVWTANPDHIIEKIRRGNQALGAVHYLKKTCKLWVWRARDGALGQLIDWELGGRDRATCERLLKRLKQRWNPGLYCADGWKAHAELIL